MPAPTITALPDYPNPLTDSQTDYNSKALAYTQAMPDFVTEANALASACDGYAAAALASETAAGASETAAAASAASALSAPGTSATSTTSLAVGTGSKTLTIQTGKAFSVGQAVLVASTAAPTTNWMWGQISSYNSGTGELVVAVTATGGSGTIAAWTVSLSNTPGLTLVPGDLVMSATGSFFKGDFTNATEASKAFIKTSTANGATRLGVLPDGTSTTALVRAYNNSTPTNAGVIQIGITNTEAHVKSFSTGSGTGLPLSLIVGASTEGLRIETAGHTRPGADNAYTCGSASYRFSVVYAGTGTINTSDGRDKTPVRPMTAAEIDAAIHLAREFGIYQFLDAVAAKGDAARLHAGMTVQRAMEIMAAYGLAPERYAFICHDVWEEEVEEVEDPAGDIVRPREQQAVTRVPYRRKEVQIIDGIPTVVPVEGVTDVLCVEHRPVVGLDGATVIDPASGRPMTHPVPVMETVEVRYRRHVKREAGDRYSFRPDELLMFIVRGLASRLDALVA